jgi:hypothetical protein
MRYLKPIFESKLLCDNLEDPDIINLQHIIEDTLSYMDVEVQAGTFYDQDDEGKFTTSVSFSIELQLEEYRLTEGQPYSGRVVDIESAFSRQEKITESLGKFTREIKSLCHRLSKMGYQINMYKFEGFTVDICFLVVDEKIVRN